MALDVESLVAQPAVVPLKRTMYMSQHGSGGLGGVPQRLVAVPQLPVPPPWALRETSSTPPVLSA